MKIGKAHQSAISTFAKSAPVMTKAKDTTQKAGDKVKGAKGPEELQKILDTFLTTKKQVIAALDAQEKSLRDAIKEAQKEKAK